MVKIVDKVRKRFLTVAVALCAYFLLLTTSTLVFWLNPGMLNCSVDFVDSLYFSVTTITTLGYGDILPYTPVGKLFASFVALSGVVFLGFFLLAVANNIAYRQERSIVEAAKRVLLVQYESDRQQLALYCVFVVDKSQELSLDFTDSIVDADVFREYFSENSEERWNKLTENLPSEPHMAEQMVRILTGLELHIRQFISIARIENVDLLRKINKSANNIRRMHQQNLRNSGQNQEFCRQLFHVLARWESQKSESNSNSNSLANAIAEV